jgi:peptidoglycan/xylan/chitin deacetylase (PgdA/CDA1 family)
LKKRRRFVKVKNSLWQHMPLSILGITVGLGAGICLLSSQQVPILNNNHVTGSQADIRVKDDRLNKVIISLAQQAESQLVPVEVPAPFEGKTLSQVKLPGKDKVIALTFDDGPSPSYTQQILSILKENNIKATFFLIGENVKNYPQLAQQEVAEGHAIANHTWSHSYRHFSLHGATHEIDDTATLIDQITGVKPSIFRPPGGFLHNGPADVAKKEKYFIALWSDDSNDWKRPGVPKLVNNLIHYAKPGAIALMHDGGGNRSQTVEALPQIIAKLKERGYKFVTVPELLEMENSELKEAALKGKTITTASKNKPSVNPQS